MTSSPHPRHSESGFALELEQRCGNSDAALARTAQALAGQLRGREFAPDPSAIVQELRRAGAPYVWPRAWMRTAGRAERSETLERLTAWLASFGDGGERRCGVMLDDVAAGRERAIVLAVDALADLRPLPTRARLSSWVDVEADMLVPARDAKVVVLGPRGRPRPLPTSTAESLVRARFNADQPGPWLVQVLADVGAGPRPVLEARVFAGAESDDVPTPRAPGEDAAAGAEAAAALALMVAEARREEDLPPLARHAELDRLAVAHAERMRAEKRVAHDVGDGDPAERVGQAGLPVSAAGENVAHAADAIRAQRALWASPSHRANLLSPRFDIVGIGVVHDFEDDSVWVCQLFAELAR